MSEQALPTAPAVDDFSELDALLASAVKEAAARKEADKARDRLKRGGQSSSSAAEDLALVRRWENENLWTPNANVALFERYRCACGRQHTVFRRLMQRQTHKTQHAERWVAVDTTKADLPSEILVHKWNTPMCTHCSEKAGFSFALHPVASWEE